MIRKQVYVEPRHDRMLKRRARERGVTEAQIIREALDRVDSGAVVRSRGVDAGAARLAVAFMRSLARRSRAPQPQPTRESLYADRIGRWTKS
jgi:hypothetical protein